MFLRIFLFLPTHPLLYSRFSSILLPSPYLDGTTEYPRTPLYVCIPSRELSYIPLIDIQYSIPSVWADSSPYTSNIILMKGYVCKQTRFEKKSPSLLLCSQRLKIVANQKIRSCCERPQVRTETMTSPPKKNYKHHHSKILPKINNASNEPDDQRRPSTHATKKRKKISLTT